MFYDLTSGFQRFGNEFATLVTSHGVMGSEITGNMTVFQQPFPVNNNAGIKRPHYRLFVAGIHRWLTFPSQRSGSAKIRCV